MEELEELRKENELLRKALYDRVAETKKGTAYNIIRPLIYEYVEENTRPNLNGMQKSSVRRDLIKDLKWELRRRTVDEFEKEDIDKTIEFLKNYQIVEWYKKENENE